MSRLTHARWNPHPNRYTDGHDHPKASLVSVQPAVAVALHDLRGRLVFGWRLHGLGRCRRHRSWRCRGQALRGNRMGTCSWGRDRIRVFNDVDLRLRGLLANSLDAIAAVHALRGDRSDCRGDGWRRRGRLFDTTSRRSEKIVGEFGFHGNAWQWCADWYGPDYYATSPANDPNGPDSGTSRVLRGGSWDGWPNITRSAYRYGLTPVGRGDFTGFRVRGLGNRYW